MFNHLYQFQYALGKHNVILIPVKRVPLKDLLAGLCKFASNVIVQETLPAFVKGLGICYSWSALLQVDFNASFPLVRTHEEFLRE